VEGVPAHGREGGLMAFKRSLTNHSMRMNVSGKNWSGYASDLFNTFINGFDINIMSVLIKFAENAKPRSSRGINLLAQEALFSLG